MKKSLIILLFIPLIFACSKDDNDDANSNDPIVGTWEIFYSEALDSSNQWGGGFDTPIGDYTWIFKSDGSYDIIDSGFLDQNMGTWTNMGNNIYKITDAEGEYSDTINFLCSNNILIYDYGGTYTTLEYFQKEGYNYQNCNEITYNAN